MMNKKLIFTGLFLIGTVLFFGACKSSPEKKMIGTWIVKTVEVDFDEMKSTPEMVNQVIEKENRMQLEFVNDSILLIKDDNASHHTVWSLNPNGGIFYRFENSPQFNLLGTYDTEEKSITTNSSTPLGTINVVYKKK